MNVLIIDDDELVCRSLERYVRFRGDQTLAATDGHSGLRLLRDRPVDLVITDVNMPDIDGLEILRRAQAQRPDLPVIVVTAYANTDMAIEAVNQGAFAFLQKPILAQALNDKITEAFDRVHRQRRTNDRLNDLEHAARSQRRKLQQEQAFSGAILRHAPFPVCLHDDNGRIHMANPPFRARFGGASALASAVPGLDTSHPVHGETLRLAVDDGVYRVSGFAVDDAPRPPLTCLFFQDISSEEELATQQRLQQQCLQGIVDFRAATADLFHHADFLRQTADLLLRTFGFFSPRGLRLRAEEREYWAGDLQPTASPYLEVEIHAPQSPASTLALFGDSPSHLAQQRDFAAKLAEIVGLRLRDRALQLRLMQTNQLRALGEMASSIGHELNQPLSGIRVFAEGLLYGLSQDWPTQPEDLQEALEGIVSQVDRMSGIIGHMRQFSPKAARETRTTFDLADVVERTLQLVGAQLANRDIALQNDISPDLPPVNGWPRHLEQVLFNLVINARQALERRRPDHPLLRLHLHSPDATHLHLAVGDNGGGIEAKAAARVFEPFFTAGSGDGPGLGLSISHHIVQQHGGRIEMDNRPGHGVTFTLILPAADGTPV